MQRKLKGMSDHAMADSDDEEYFNGQNSPNEKKENALTVYDSGSSNVKYGDVLVGNQQTLVPFRSGISRENDRDEDSDRGIDRGRDRDRDEEIDNLDMYADTVADTGADTDTDRQDYFALLRESRRLRDRLAESYSTDADPDAANLDMDMDMDKKEVVSMSTSTSIRDLIFAMRRDKIMRKSGKTLSFAEYI